jgi:hypothetical protein
MLFHQESRRIKNQTTLFSLNMLTCTYERQEHSKDYREVGSAVKKGLSDLALHLHVKIKN